MEVIKDITALVTAIGVVLVTVLQIVQQFKLKTMAKELHTVEINTNHMKDQLMAKTESEALARGGVEERARAEIRAKERGVS